MNNKPPLSTETQLIHEGREYRSAHRETSEALFLTSGYIYDSAEEAEQAFNGEKDRFVYSRYANPTVTVFENRLLALEKGAERCHATASGMAACHLSLLSQLKKGDRIVAARALFGSCYYIINTVLPRFGIEVAFVDGGNLAEWREALSTPAKIVFFETPSNPLLTLVDIEAVSELAHGAGATVVVDNVFATPVLQTPMLLGADIVFYSTTKHIDGQGRCLGGAVLCSEAMSDDIIMPFYKHTGPSLSPFNAWVMLKGLETLPLRVERQCETALKIAHFLEKEQAPLADVQYPGLESHPQHDLARKQMAHPGGSMIAFELKGQAEAFRFLNQLSLILLSNNLGDTKTLVTHPTTTTHQSLTDEERAILGIRPGHIRLSVGLEKAEDLIADIAQALKKV